MRSSPCCDCGLGCGFWSAVYLPCAVCHQPPHCCPSPSCLCSWICSSYADQHGSCSCSLSCGEPCHVCWGICCQQLPYSHSASQSFGGPHLSPDIQDMTGEALSYTRPLPAAVYGRRSDEHLEGSASPCHTDGLRQPARAVEIHHPGPFLGQPSTCKGHGTRQKIRHLALLPYKSSIAVALCHAHAGIHANT